MHLKRKKATEILRRLSELLEKKPAKLDEEDVHHMRTNTRKAETLLDALPAKLAKRARMESQLKKLRKRAGAVRDADVQIGLLSALSLHSAPPSAAGQKEHLTQALHLQRTMGLKRLNKFLEKNASDLRKRLAILHDHLPKNHSHHAASLEKIADDGDDALNEAIRRFRQLAVEHPVLNPSNLHDFRKRCKHIRYLAELGNETTESRHFAQQLTSVQDAIGSWHDWQTLHALAFQLGMHHDLLAVIQTLEDMERHKYAEAIRVAEDAMKSTALPCKSASRKKPPARPTLTIVRTSSEPVPA